MRSVIAFALVASGFLLAGCAGDTYPTGKPSLLADVQEGQAPLSVTFTLERTKAGSAPLSWTLDTNGDGTSDHDGTELPANVTEVFASGGLFNVTFTITAGDDIATESVTINVTSPAPVVITGTAQVANPAADTRCLQDGMDGDMHNLAPAEPGWTFSVEPATGYSVYFWGAGDYIGPGGGATGEVPDDADEIEVCKTSPTAPNAYTVTLTAP